MELGAHAAFGAADQAAEIPFLTRRLDAVRCAFKYVASIMTVLVSALPPVAQRLVGSVVLWRTTPA
jgi:hypothetical protein